MPTFSDQTGNAIEIRNAPKRIVSLVPSQTELLYDLGLNESVAGITKFCVHPREWFRNKAKVGGTKDVQINVVHSIQPDLVIANKEENTKEQVEEIMLRYPVWVSDVATLKDALDMIRSIGMITKTTDKAGSLVTEIEAGFTRLANRLDSREKLRTAYLIWRKPYMTAGGDTFIHSMMQFCGYKNIFEEEHRYPVITIEHLKQKDCQQLLLSSEPYPFKQKHVEELNEQLPDTKIRLVDGEYFSWYGSRLLHAPGYFEKLLG